MFYQSMPLYLRLLDLLKLEYRLVANLPKQYKYSLGQDIITLTWNMVDLFIEAQTRKTLDKEKKIDLIYCINKCHDCLKLRFRFCGELKLITLRQQTKIDVLTVEIGKMVGCWLKNV